MEGGQVVRVMDASEKRRLAASAVLQIRDAYPGSDFFPSRIHIKESGFFIPDPDPGSRGQKGTGSRIRIRNTATSDDAVCE
jgi:hypothetical protein